MAHYILSVGSPFTRDRASFGREAKGGVNTDIFGGLVKGGNPSVLMMRVSETSIAAGVFRLTRETNWQGEPQLTKQQKREGARSQTHSIGLMGLL